MIKGKLFIYGVATGYFPPVSRKMLCPHINSVVKKDQEHILEWLWGLWSLQLWQKRGKGKRKKKEEKGKDEEKERERERKRKRKKERGK